MAEAPGPGRLDEAGALAHLADILKGALVAMRLARVGVPEQVQDHCLGRAWNPLIWGGRV